MQTSVIVFSDAAQYVVPIADTYFGTTSMDQKARNKIIMQAIRRWCLYTFATILLVSLVSFCMQSSTSIVGQFLATLWYAAPIAAASLALLPLLIFEMISHNKQFTGPIRRVRGEIQKLKDGQVIRELRLREGDYWHELVNDFNELADQIDSERNPNVDDFTPTIFSINRACE